MLGETMEKVKRKLGDARPNRREIFSVPNGLSFLRLCLIPWILYCYNQLEATRLAAGLFALSAMLDVADGAIARRSRRTTRLGRILDPVAGKLTQAALLVSLAPEYKWTFGLAVLFAVREIVAAVLRRVSLTEGETPVGNRWYARAASALISLAMLALLFFEEMPEWTANLLLGGCALAIVGSCGLICRDYARTLKGKMEPRHKRKLIKNAVLITGWAAVIAVCIVFKDHITVTDIVEHTPRNSLLAAVVMLALFALKSISVVIYGSALYAASGLLFPLPTAVLVNLMGTVIMVSIPYSVGAANGAEVLENLFRKHPKAAMLKSLRAGSDFFFALLVRLLGVLPGDLVGAYMGASGVKYPAYLAGTVLGMLPSMITFPLMGMNIRRVGSPEFLISAGIQVAMSILSVILYFVLRKKNREEKGMEYEEN